MTKEEQDILTEWHDMAIVVFDFDGESPPGGEGVPVVYDEIRQILEQNFQLKDPADPYEVFNAIEPIADRVHEKRFQDWNDDWCAHHQPREENCDE